MELGCKRTETNRSRVCVCVCTGACCSGKNNPAREVARERGVSVSVHRMCIQWVGVYTDIQAALVCLLG